MTTDGLGPVTAFYLIRHAEKDCDPELLTGRKAGIGLTARGERQARALARHLRSRPLARIFASPLERAQRTAAIIGEATGVAVETCPALDEFDCGAWSGRTFAELAGDAQWNAFNTLRSTVRPPGGESALEVQGRMVAALLQWHQEYPDGAIAVVSHGDPLKFAIGYFLGAPLDHFLRIELEMASVSVLTMHAGHPVLRSLNERPAEGRGDDQG